MNCSSNASGIAFHQVILKAEEDKLKMWRTDVLNKLIDKKMEKMYTSFKLIIFLRAKFFLINVCFQLIIWLFKEQFIIKSCRLQGSRIYLHKYCTPFCSLYNIHVWDKTKVMVQRQILNSFEKGWLVLQLLCYAYINFWHFSCTKSSSNEIEEDKSV